MENYLELVARLTDARAAVARLAMARAAMAQHECTQPDDPDEEWDKKWGQLDDLVSSRRDAACVAFAEAFRMPWDEVEEIMQR